MLRCLLRFRVTQLDCNLHTSTYTASGSQQKLCVIKEVAAMVSRDSADKVAERLATGRIRKRQDGRPGVIRDRAGFGNVQLGHEGGS